jgi:hypothetical protein
MLIWKLLPLVLALLYAVPASAGHTWHYSISGWNHDSFNEEVLEIVASGPGSAHDMLSATHTDTTPSAVTNYSIIMGIGGKWAEYVVGTGVLFGNGTTLAYDATPAIDCTNCTNVPAPSSIPAANVTFTPDNAAEWIVTPSEVDAALEDLAPRVTANDLKASGPHTTDTGPSPDCTGTQLQQGDAACVDRGFTSGDVPDGSLVCQSDGTNCAVGGDDHIVAGQLQMTAIPLAISSFADATGGVVRATAAAAHGLTSADVSITDTGDCKASTTCVYSSPLATDNSGQEIVIESTTYHDGIYTPTENVRTDLSAFSDEGGGDVRLTFTDTHTFKNGESVTIAGTTNYNGTFTITSVPTAWAITFTDTWVADDCPCTGDTVTSNDSFKIADAYFAPDTGTWTFGRKITIRDTTNYDGTWTAFNFSGTDFDFYDTWVATDTGTYTSIIKFDESDTTPDVDGGSFFETADNPVIITNFEWAGAQADEFGHVLYIRSMGKTTYDCTSAYLLCGTNAVSTNAGDITAWVGVEREGTGSTYWEMLSYTNQQQSYGDRFLQEQDPQSFGITHLKDTKFHGYVDVGAVEYFIEDDGTPDVSNGVFFYSYECTDNYDAHCVDVFNSRSGGPCNDGDVQCSGASPDSLCDFDGLSSPTQAPQRVGVADTKCDADGTTSYPASAPINAPIYDFDGGVDGQLIIVVTRDQTLTFDCVGSATLECGTAALATQKDDVSQWIYNGIDDAWHLVAFENNNQGGALKAGLDTKNTFTEPQTFEGGIAYGAPGVFVESDTTPDVSGSSSWTTDDDVTVTITALDGGIEGAVIFVTADFLTRYDCDQAGLTCGTGLLPQADGDITEWIYAGSAWLLTGYFNASAQHEQDWATLGANTFTGIQDGTGWEITPVGRITGTEVRSDLFSLAAGATIMSFGTNGSAPTQFDFLSDIGYVVLDGDISMEEMLTNLGYGAGYGTYWVKTAIPNLPMFSDDGGTEGQLARINFDHTWTGIQTFDAITTRAWDPTPTYDAIIGDAVGGQLKLGTGVVGMADTTWSTTDFDGIMVFRNTVDQIEDIAFLFMGGASDVPRFVLPEEGPDLATYNPRSMVIGPAATIPNMDENILCSTNFSVIDCNTSATGADLGVQDDIEVLGNIYGTDLYSNGSAGTGTVYGGVFTRANAGTTTMGSVTTTWVQFVSDAGAMIFDAEAWWPERANNGFGGTPGYGTWWIRDDAPNTPMWTDDDGTDMPLNHYPPVCKYIEDPVSSETFESLWRANTSLDILEIWCETDAGTVGLDLEIDDGTPLGINGSDISCAVSTGTADSTFANSATMAAGDRLDAALGTVTSAEVLRICWTYRPN